MLLRHTLRNSGSRFARRVTCLVLLLRFQACPSLIVGQSGGGDGFLFCPSWIPFLNIARRWSPFASASGSVALSELCLFQEYEETCLFTKHESLQGDSPRVHPNILKCSLHSLVTKGIRLVGFATRVMVCESPTHYLILNSLAFARGCVILRSHFLILLLLIILISHHIHS